MSASAFEPFGDAALRAPLPTGVSARAALEALRACDGVIDVVVTETHACAYFDPERVPRGLDAALSRARARTQTAADDDDASPRVHVVRVRYDGEDLEEVAAQTKLEVRDVVRAHVARVYAVKMIGFLPGFAYLGDNDARIAVPRRPTPRTRVPPGAVAIAAEYTGIYPFASPGGWNLIGHAVDFALFDPVRGATLGVGDRVRFESVT